jgi:hypothetical protein
VLSQESAPLNQDMEGISINEWENIQEMYKNQRGWVAAAPERRRASC